MTASSSRHTAAGFSLIEVLMSIFILGIGVISIAALFPAGIAQQRQSTDDIIGSLVANNALAIIRSKVNPDDFGSFEEFGPVGEPLCPPIGGRPLGPDWPGCPRATIEGDWGWMRPTFIFPGPTRSELPQNGAIDIFSAVPAGFDLPLEYWASESGGGLVFDIPYNTDKYEFPPTILITQEERYYPQSTEFAPIGLRAKPQYVWECMFRRFGGKVLVAIFVYRVNAPGGETAAYTVARNPAPNGSVPPLPIWLDLEDDANLTYSADGVWDYTGPNDPPGRAPIDRDDVGYGDDNFIHGFGGPVGSFTLGDARMAWQTAGQWIVDQNNDVHRVLSASRDDANDPVQVELVRPIVPKAPVDPDGSTSSPYYTWEIVSNIWYLPVIDANDVQLTPVYVTVKEL